LTVCLLHRRYRYHYRAHFHPMKRFAVRFKNWRRNLVLKGASSDLLERKCPRASIQSSWPGQVPEATAASRR